jgi:hypothetical protein
MAAATSASLPSTVACQNGAGSGAQAPALHWPKG